MVFVLKQADRQTDITSPICFHYVYVMQIVYKRQIDACPFHRTSPKTVIGNQSVANIFKLDNRITTPQPSFLLLQTQFNIQFNLLNFLLAAIGFTL